MKVLIDTNILIDYFAKRPLFFENAREIIKLCTQKKIDGSIAAHSITNAFYILRKDLTLPELREALTRLCSLVSVIGIDKNKLLRSIADENFDDIEDRLQAECAADFGADYIITRNVKDFTQSTVPAVLPEEFLKQF